MRWWQIRKRDADLNRELRSDLELEEEEQRERGLSAEEARHAALRAFGNPTLIREHTHEVWSWNGLENLLRDLRISVRTLYSVAWLFTHCHPGDGIVHRGCNVAVHGDAVGSAPTASFPRSGSAGDDL